MTLPKGLGSEHVFRSRANRFYRDADADGASGADDVALLPAKQSEPEV